MGWNQREVGSLGGIPTGLPLACQAALTVGAHRHTWPMELPTVVAVVIAVVSLLLNIAAVLISKSQVTAAKSQTEVQRQIHRDSSQPYVWADIRLNPDDGATLDWVVGNSGPTVATDVTFRVDPPFGEIHPLTSTAIERMANGIASLPPGRTNWWSLEATYDLVKSTSPQPRTITIDATGPFGPLPTLEYIIDMTDFREANVRPDGSLHLLAEAVDRRPSVKDVTALTGALRRLAEQRADDPPTDE